MSLSSQATAEFQQSSSTNEPKVQPKEYFKNRMEFAKYSLTASGLTISDIDFGKTLLLTQTAAGTVTLPAAAVSAGAQFDLIMEAQSDHAATFSAASGEVINTAIVHTAAGALVLNNVDISFTVTGSSAGAGATQLKFFCDGIAWYATGATTEVAAS